LLGFPQTEIHCEKLKEYGLDFDRIIYLNDNGDEEKELEAGQSIAKRIPLPDEVEYDWEFENEKAQRVLGVVKEAIGDEDHFEEIDCAGDIDQVFINIKTKIDPFFALADNEENYEVQADIDNDEDDPNPKFLPRSDFGTFCPVTFLNENYLIRGDPEQECTHHGKTFTFATEK